MTQTCSMLRNFNFYQIMFFILFAPIAVKSFSHVTVPSFLKIISVSHINIESQTSLNPIILNHENRYRVNIMKKFNTIKSKKSDEDFMSVDEMYKIAMEEDEEWYNTFVKGVVSESDSEIEQDQDKTRTDERSLEKLEQIHVITKDSSVEEEAIESIEEGDTQFLSNNNTQSLKYKEKKVVDFNVQNKIENVPDSKASSTSKGIDSSILNEGTRDSETYQNLDEIVVQFRDYRGEVQSTPFSKLKRLGYILSEVAQLQSNALHFILEDNIEKPETGVPESWMVNQNGEEKQVFLLKKKKGVRKSKNRDYSGRMMEKSSSRKFQRQYFDNDYESESEMPKNFWMNLPTFKRYLRNEAELRLWILGPDWEELVRGESEWRLQLYKQWLRAVDNGIGEDAFDQLSSVPITRRRKRVNRSEINDMPRRRSVPRRERPGYPPRQNSDDQNMDATRSRRRRNNGSRRNIE